MASKGTASYRQRRAEAERRRRNRTERAQSQPEQADSVDFEKPPPGRRKAASDCAWCGGPITPRSRGPIPKWCSATRRHRAWEQARAAVSGRSSVQVVERRVEVPVPVPVSPGRRDWPGLLDELARQIDDGRVYDRDLLDLSDALSAALEAYCRRAYVRSGLLDEQRGRRAGNEPVAP